MAEQWAESIYLLRASGEECIGEERLAAGGPRAVFFFNLWARNDDWLPGGVGGRAAMWIFPLDLQRD